jgi:hypothetical protein
MTTVARGTSAVVLAAAATLLAGCGGGQAGASRPHHWELDTGDTRVLDLRPSRDTPPTQLVDVPAGSRRWVLHVFCSGGSGPVTVSVSGSPTVSTRCTRVGQEALHVLGPGPAGVLPRHARVAVTAPGMALLSLAADASPRRD